MTKSSMFTEAHKTARFESRKFGISTVNPSATRSAAFGPLRTDTAAFMVSTKKGTQMTNLQKLLADARIEFVKAMDWLHEVRKNPTAPEWMLEGAIQMRHRASDRVWELQCMAEGSLR